MTDKETLERIEEDGLQFAISKDVPTCSFHIGCRQGYIAGAISERKKVLDEAIEYFQEFKEENENEKFTPLQIQQVLQSLKL
ncbi:MAG TPA: hypothetical protein VGK39_07405 [Cyclobacteriaceae bacterium]